jgi:carboxymethylenebutenolidase
MSDETSGLTRRDVIKVGTAASLAGYAVGVEKVLAQAIKTDTDGITAGDAEVAIGSYNMPVYEARPASGGPAPIVVCISEIWGVHEWVRDMTRRFAKAGYYAVAPELFKREGGVAQLPNIQDILKIVLAVPRKQVLGDVAATVDWAKKRPGVRADRAGVTGWCWGGSTVYQVAATNPDMKAGVVWYGPPARPYPDQPNPVTGFDVAKDIKIPMLGLFGETDTGPSPADARTMFNLLKQVNSADELVVYPGAGHGFMADYRPSYNPTAAADAWKRCTGWFDSHLKA